MVEYSDNRLERIEKKIDQLSEAFVIMARTEEKLIVAERDRTEMQLRLHKMDDKLTELHNKIDDHDQVTSMIKKMFWLVAAAIAGAYAFQIPGFN